MEISNYLVTIIIGDKNSNYDGKIISRSYGNSHIMTINKVKKILSFIDYDLNFKYNDELSDIIFNLILQGHIVFFNLSCSNKKIGSIYLPNKITEKQLLSLNKLYSQLKDFKLMTFSLDLKNTGEFIMKEELEKTKKKK